MKPTDSLVCPECGEPLTFALPWEALIAVARQTLDRHYPAHVFTGVSGDTGPRFVVKMREALAILGEE